MKKAIYLILILFVTILTTGCINNLAIEELNNKAAEYMEKGDYPNAISRLEASIDLDNSIFETQYNLAIAYTENEDYDKAIETFNKAIKLNDKKADVYYSLAVAYENYAKSIYNGETKEQKELKDDENPDNNSQFDEKGNYKATKDEIDNVKNYYNLAIENYNKYSELNTSNNSYTNINEKIDELKQILDTLNNSEATN
ncbi:tetratricopeptide repeat protein [bacterium]|nr:tetratricopeptide repeat protein [bacterium]